MAKGPSKADLILSEARERVARAQQTVDTAEGQLGIALASLNAHQMAYDALLKALTPKPRKKAATASPAQAKTLTDKKEKEPAKADAPKSNGQLCTAKIPGLDVECRAREDDPIHDPNAGYGGFHRFAIAALVAEKKSRRKGAGASSTPSTEIGSDAAMPAGAD